MNHTVQTMGTFKKATTVSTPIVVRKSHWSYIVQNESIKKSQIWPVSSPSTLAVLET